MKNIFIFIFMLCFSIFVNAKNCEQIESKNLKGQFINNDKFDGKYTYCRFDAPEEQNISQIDITLKINSHINTYLYTGGAYPSIEVSNLGIISIYDKSGGMQSPAKITYLASKNDELIKLGEINLSYDLGQVSEYFIQYVNDDIENFNSTILANKQDNFINDAPLSYTDSFLLLLSDKALTKKTDPIWMQKFYTKLQTMWYQDIINLYNQNIFFKDKTLCKKEENEKDVFGCEIKNNQLSICYNYDKQSLIYKFGKKSNIQLELQKEIIDKDSKIIEFKNTNTDYIINTKEGQEGLLIRQNNEIIREIRCQSDSIEPMILDGLN